MRWRRLKPLVAAVLRVSLCAVGAGTALPSPARATILMNWLDQCQDGDVAERIRLQRVTDMAARMTENRPSTRDERWQAYEDLQRIRRDKIICVYNTVLRLLDPKARLGAFEETWLGRRVMTDLALYHGFKSAESQEMDFEDCISARQEGEGDQEECARLAVMSTIERQGVVFAVGDFFTRLDRERRDRAFMTLGEMARERLDEVSLLAP
jgi:hypothetical protein